MFDCPRCGASDVRTQFYGPCPECRVQLNATMYREPAERSEAAAYMPKMNVTPNAVALKEDN